MPPAKKTKIMLLSKKAFFISLSFFLILFSCQKIDINRINKITTDNVTITGTEVDVAGTIIDVGKSGITKFGHCWSVNSKPTITDTKTEFNSAEVGKIFNSKLNNLSVNSVYYVCSYATNGDETIYGEIKSFTITSFSNIAVVISNLQIQNETTLTVDGGITGIGSLNVIDYGHCFATHTLPIISDLHTSNGTLSSDINFSSTLSGLNLDTTYYVRTYVKLSNSNIIYSTELSILIPDLKVTTDNFAVTGATAVLGGTIVNLGVLPVVDHGHCWSSATSNPNINDNIISHGATTTTGAFFSNLPLTSGTTYYFKAYARKGTTLKYGVVKMFTY